MCHFSSFSFHFFLLLLSHTSRMLLFLAEAGEGDCMNFLIFDGSLPPFSEVFCLPLLHRDPPLFFSLFVRFDACLCCMLYLNKRVSFSLFALVADPSLFYLFLFSCSYCCCGVVVSALPFSLFFIFLFNCIRTTLTPHVLLSHHLLLFLIFDVSVCLLSTWRSTSFSM